MNTLFLHWLQDKRDTNNKMRRESQVCYKQETSCFQGARHCMCISHTVELQLTLAIPLSVPAHHRKMETSFLKEYNKLCRTCLQQHLVYQKPLFQPVLLAALEMQWCPTAIWLGLLPSSYLHWLIEPLPPKYWRYTAQSLRKCMWLEQTHTRWSCKIAVRRKVSHWADASFILEKQLASCHFPLTHLLGERCLF